MVVQERQMTPMLLLTWIREKEKEKAIESEPDVEAVTRKFGLEAGLWKVGFFLSP